VVYDVAHHGSVNSNSEEFVNLIRPDISVISCGKDNSYGHPAEEVLKCLEDVGSEILCTFNCGQIEIYEEKGKIMLREFVDE
jgi:competence protein ComEC